MKEIIRKILLKIPKMIRNFLVEDLVKEHKIFHKEIDQINSKIDENEKDRLRHEILSFASSLRRGEKHTTQEFDTIFMFHSKYETIIKRLNVSNGYLDDEFNYIIKKFQERKKEIF